MKIRGLLAEIGAIRYLQKHGYRVLHTRYRGNGGEIDLIADDHGVTVFIEVKSSSRLGDGAKRVVTEKKQLIKKAAREYLRTHSETEFRYDIVEESDAGYRLIRGAF